MLRTEPVTEKWEAFGWYIQRVDGNDVGALLAAFDNAAAQAAAVGRPSVILCDTKVGRAFPCWKTAKRRTSCASRNTNGRPAASN